ncbi:MAG: hypothetical protein ACLR13_03920 [Acutalibacteraceae bacterium]
MKAMKSKWLALFLTVIMTFTLLPSVVFAAGEDTEVAKLVTKHITALLKQLQQPVRMLQPSN